ncbi:MAG: hypothetical protein DWQ07_18285 [Chloroflexi bacterium]|nr:MAG: hypothetical protein DWQ07_18285 [Chloroflexota bacterium]MBL1197368.1 hypothetical protein [Chloroflexota bacterium]NOH14665.1 hypothetical protein [Chloroflexota bacterium]
MRKKLLSLIVGVAIPLLGSACTAALPAALEMQPGPSIPSLPTVSPSNQLPPQNQPGQQNGNGPGGMMEGGNWYPQESWGQGNSWNMMDSCYRGAGYGYDPAFTPPSDNGNWTGGMMEERNWNQGSGWNMMDPCYQVNGNGYGTTPNQPADGGSLSISPADISFQADVQPILNTRCVACHGGANDLYLDSYTNITRGGKNGPVIFPSEPSNSLLIQYVASGYMPYGGPPLTQTQLQTLVSWIVAGAPNN